MVVKRKITKKYYFMTFVVTTLIFLVAFFLGFFVNNLNYSSTLDELSNMKTGLLRYDLQYKLLGEYPCEYSGDSPLSGEFEEVRLRIAKLENELGKQDNRVLTLKTYYSLLEISDFLYYADLNKKCGTDYDLILYFYSNEDECPMCNEQGFVLSYLKKVFGDKLLIFSFNAEIFEEPMVEILKTAYNVTEYPGLVIDEDTYLEFSSTEKLMELICGKLSKDTEECQEYNIAQENGIVVE